MTAYEVRRNAATLPDYHENLQMAQLMPPPPDVIALRAALRDRPEDARLFAMAAFGMLPRETSSIPTPWDASWLPAGHLYTEIRPHFSSSLGCSTELPPRRREAAFDGRALPVECSTWLQTPRGCRVRRRPAISAEPFGAVHGESVERYTLVGGDLRVRILTYGGIVQSIEAPDRDGRSLNVALGFTGLDDYVSHSPFFGAIIGRFANRIASGCFSLDALEYAVPTNDGSNALHGGPSGFDKRVWRARTSQEANGVALHLTYLSPHGDQGFPGALDVEVTYTLDTHNQLRLDYRATTDRPTVGQPHESLYFNLAGEGAGSIGDHVLTLAAARYTPIDAT